MSADESSPDIHFGIHLGTETSAREIDPQTPFRIAVIGDFSGRAQRGGGAEGELLSQMQPRLIDRDNFEEVMRKLDVRLERLLLASDQQSVSLRIEELDDFDPDVLYDKLDVFESLRDLRQRLLNRETFDGAAAEVMKWSSAEKIAAASEPATPADATAVAESVPVDQLLDQILDDAQQNVLAGAGNIELQLDRLIGEIVAPYALPAADPRQQDLIGCVDAAIQSVMLAILQHPSFKQLEADWRALRQLVFDLETDSSLKVYLIDISKPELAADMLASKDLRQSHMYRLLVDETVNTPGGKPWAMMTAACCFGNGRQDVVVLGRLAKIAAAAGAPLVAGAEGSIVGCVGADATGDSDDWQAGGSDYWQTLRELPESGYLALVWPRFLLRLPYGRSTKPIERFAFEEIESISDKRRLLWGNSVFLIANMLGRSYTRSLWNLALGDVAEIDHLPVWIYQDEDGDSQAYPCGEFLLREKALARVGEYGVIPMISVRDQPSIRIGGFRSLAGTLLKGRWS